MVGPGYYIALAREHAKTLFGIKEDAALRTFLEELRTRSDIKRSGRLLEAGTLWEPIHRCLTEGELDPTAGDFPLNHAVLGGKQLHQSSDYTAVLVRPDMTRFIADALQDLEEDDMRKKFFALPSTSYQGVVDEKRFIEMWLRLQDLKVFFQAAAENMEAVVFTAKLEPQAV